MRLAQSSSISNKNPEPNTQAISTGAKINGSRSISPIGHRFASVEVAIPVKKTHLSSHGSSTPSVVADTVGDGLNEYSTPMTSVTVTPAESDVNTSKKRISATARARELRSSAVSLDIHRGLKRAPDHTSAHIQTDADLARSLQIQEYQNPVTKRQRLSVSTRRRASEVQDSTDDDTSLVHDESSEVNERDAVTGWRLRVTRAPPSAVNPGTTIADSEGSDSIRDNGSDAQDDVYQSDPDLSDSVPSASTTEDEPLLPWRSRNVNMGNASTRMRRRTRTEAPASRPSWMSNRVGEQLLQILSLAKTRFRPSKNE